MNADIHDPGRRPAPAGGENGMSIVLTGNGEAMHDARDAPHGRIDDVVMPNMYYSDDIGERWTDGDHL